MRGHYAIEIIGCRKQRFYIKKVTVTGLILPVDGKPYRTLGKAQEAAEKLGLLIEKVGDCYEIL